MKTLEDTGHVDFVWVWYFNNVFAQWLYVATHPQHAKNGEEKELRILVMSMIGGRLSFVLK